MSDPLKNWVQQIREWADRDPAKALALLEAMDKHPEKGVKEALQQSTASSDFLRALVHRLIAEKEERLEAQEVQDSGQGIPYLLEADFEIGLQKMYAFAESLNDADDQVDQIILLKYQWESGALTDLAEAKAQALPIWKELETRQPEPASDSETAQFREKLAGLDINEEVVAAVKAVNFTYPGGDFSITDISAEFKLGQITGVVGRNGNGKTTFFKLLIGQMAAQSGSIEFPHFHQENEPTDWTKVKAMTSYVPQDLPTWRGTLQGNLHLEASHRGLTGKENKWAVEYIIHRLGLMPHLHKQWSDLSGGYKMRFALARALVWNPKFLVIDEPLANLDVEAQARFLNDIRHMSRNLKHPISVVLSSQHLYEVESVADQLLMLEQGSVAYLGHVDGVGSSRNNNIFEFSTPLDFQALEAKLNGYPYTKLERRGLNYILHTSLNQHPASFLEYALRRGITLDYFRDISRSVKQYFL